MAFHIVKTQYTDKIRKVIRIILRVNSLCVASCIKQFKVWMPACVSKVCVVQCHNLVKASNSMFLTSVPCTFFFFFFKFHEKEWQLHICSCLCTHANVCVHQMYFYKAVLQMKVENEIFNIFYRMQEKLTSCIISLDVPFNCFKVGRTIWRTISFPFKLVTWNSFKLSLFDVFLLF